MTDPDDDEPMSDDVLNGDPFVVEMFGEPVVGDDFRGDTAYEGKPNQDGGGGD